MPQHAIESAGDAFDVILAAIAEASSDAEQSAFLRGDACAGRPVSLL